jgi:2',3'-cyclic-nucleotide 2'-phosphodiesterase
VFGAPGRRAIESRLPELRREHRVDFCIVNGENAAAGRGITAKIADRLLASGADVVTLGNWVWGQQGFAPYLSGTDRVLRPANMSPQTPGRGLAIHDGVAVINLLGSFSLDPFESAFLAADRLVEEARRETRVVIVDFHAEATSEKVALARYLDGRATAVIGTHTHVQRTRRRNRGDDGRGDDRAARLGDRERRAERDQALPHRHAVPARTGERRRSHRGCDRRCG